MKAALPAAPRLMSLLRAGLSGWAARALLAPEQGQLSYDAVSLFHLVATPVIGPCQFDQES